MRRDFPPVLNVVVSNVAATVNGLVNLVSQEVALQSVQMALYPQKEVALGVSSGR